MKKKIMIGLLVILVILQFVRPTKNESGNTTNDISTKYPMPDSVKMIINKSCADCHSNKTEYPWYASVQPLYFWLDHHVVEGKSELNFNEFASYRIGKQNHKLKEVIEQIQKDEMPMSSYTVIHKEAKLTEVEKATLINWCQTIMDTIKANYPADSLILKRKPQPNAK
jgi:Haem-binding domain